MVMKKPAKGKAHPLVERYGSLVERYPNQKARKKHEKAEGWPMENKEKAMAKKGGAKKMAKGGKGLLGTNKAGQRTAAQRG